MLLTAKESPCPTSPSMSSRTPPRCRADGRVEACPAVATALPRAGRGRSHPLAGLGRAIGLRSGARLAQAKAAGVGTAGRRQRTCAPTHLAGAPGGQPGDPCLNTSPCPALPCPARAHDGRRHTVVKPCPDADRVLLAHMRDCLPRILKYTNAERSRFDSSRPVQDAVIRNLQTLAESSQRLSKEIKDTEPKVPWRELAGFRNVIVHGSLGVDLGAVWSVVEKDLPAPTEAVNRTADRGWQVAQLCQQSYPVHGCGGAALAVTPEQCHWKRWRGPRRHVGADPVQFRPDHITDERLSGVLQRVATAADRKRALPSTLDARRGRGVACSIYKAMRHAAVVAEVGWWWPPARSRC